MVADKKTQKKAPVNKKVAVKKAAAPAAKPKKATVSTGKDSIDNLLKEVQTRSEALDFAGAIQILDTVLAIDPGHQVALNFKGMMLVGKCDFKEALKCFDRLIKENPANKEAINNKAITLHYLGREEEALKCLDSAIALDRRYSDAFISKAVILFDMGKEDEAKAMLAKGRALEAIMG